MASASSAQEKESMPTILSLFDELPGLDFVEQSEIDHTIFHLFPRVPIELRLLIWDLACNVGRKVQIEVDERMYLAGSRTPFPSVLLANKESRAQALLHYDSFSVFCYLDKDEDRKSRHLVYVNFNVDIIHFHALATEEIYTKDENHMFRANFANKFIWSRRYLGAPSSRSIAEKIKYLKLDNYALPDHYQRNNMLLATPRQRARLWPNKLDYQRGGGLRQFHGLKKLTLSYVWFANSTPCKLWYHQNDLDLYFLEAKLEDDNWARYGIELTEVELLATKDTFKNAPDAATLTAFIDHRWY